MSDIREQLRGLAAYVSETDPHGSDQVLLHRERLAETLWMAATEIDDLRGALNLERRRAELKR